MVYAIVPFPDRIVLAGVTKLMSPVLPAVITVLFALVMVTTAKVFGLPFLGNDKLDGADKTHGGGVGEETGDAAGEGDGEIEGDGPGSTVGSGEGPTTGLGEGSAFGEEDGDGSVDGLGLGEGSVPPTGLGTGEPETTVEGLELSVISAISLS